MRNGEVRLLLLALWKKREWSSKRVGNPEGIPVLDADRVPISNPELRRRRPACFTRPQWHDWVTAAVRHYDGSEEHGYCRYCTPEYHAAQVVAGSCAHPKVVFDDDPVDGTVGRRVMWLKQA